MTILERRQRLQVRRRFLSTVAPSKTSLSSTQFTSILRWRKPPPPLTVPVTTTTTTTTSNSNSTGTFTPTKNPTTTTSTAMNKLLWKMKRDYRKRRVVAMSGSKNSRSSRNNNNNMATKLYMDRTTLAVMKLEVQQLLLQDEILQRTTSPLSMVNALLGSKHLLNVYAEEEEAAIGVSSFSSSKGLLYNENDSHPAPLVVRRFGGVPLLSRSRGGSYLATANTSTQRRYDFVNTLNQLQQLVSSSSSSSNDNKSIASWQDAMAILSKVLYFPLDNDDDDDVESNSAISSLIVKEPDGTSALTTTNETFTSPSIHHSTDPRTEMFLQRLRDIRIEEMSPPGLRLSQHKWLDIATTALQSNSSRHQDDPVNEEEALVHHVATPLFRDLTDEEQDRLDRIMEQGSGTDIVARTDDDTDSVQRSNLRTLLPYEWVNDEVIHYYLSLLQQRDEQLCRRANSSANKKKRTHFFKSFFMTKLLDEGNINPALDGVYNYNNVKRWSKKVPGKDIFNLSKIIFPINQGNQHWTSAVIDLEEQRIQYYDSLGGSGRHYLKVLLQYLQDEHLDKKKTPMKCPELWTLVPCTDDTPRQQNGYDCGVFTCLFADFLSIDRSFEGFDPSDMALYRQHIALSIIKGEVIS